MRKPLMFSAVLLSLGRASGRHAVRNRRPRRGFVPQLLSLEDRTVPATFTVSTLADAGAGSLRDAVQKANLTTAADVVRFAGNLHGTLTLSSEIAITNDLTIDGPGAAKITVSGGGTTRLFDVSGASTDVTI